MNNIRIGQRVEAIVERVESFGVFARLEDETVAYLRCRELDLDADVNPSDLLKTGDKINAQVISITGRNVELIARVLLPDPWPEFSRQHHVGDVVNGTVRALHPEGIFVRIGPGLSGFVPLSALATWEVKKPEELYSVGDWIQANIVQILPDTKKLTLSIRMRLEQLDRAAGLVWELGDNSIEKDVKNKMWETDVSIVPTTPFTSDQIERIGSVLIVDDHAEVRDSIAEYLQRLNLEVSKFDSLDGGITYIQDNACGVAIIDLDLSGTDGLVLVHRLRQLRRNSKICVMSTPEMLRSKMDEIEGAQVNRVFIKPLDMTEIESLLHLLVQGKPLSSWKVPNHQSGNSNLAMGEISGLYTDDGSLKEQLRTTLSHITHQIGAEISLIFHMEPLTRSISILTQVGKTQLNMEAHYGLEDSPIEDVIQESITVLENRISKRAHARFSKLLELLEFDGCIGVPILTGSIVHHAAFFFLSQGGAFLPEHLRIAVTGSYLLATFLREEAINDMLLSLNPLLLSGQLAAGFTHEVSNKISGFEISIRNLISSKSNSRSEMTQELNEIYHIAQEIKQTVELFRQSFYQRDQMSTINISSVINSAVMMFRATAQKQKTRIDLKPLPDLPLINGNRLALQQVFINIILNAVQQMVIKAEKNQWQGLRLLEIKATYEMNKNAIKMYFQDNGPGIHYHHWEEIFELGFSTRGSSGLGLFIAKSLMKSFGGTIRVLESYIPSGTTFLVEIPVM